VVISALLMTGGAGTHTVTVAVETAPLLSQAW
jgi:hypothetical protein